MEAQPELKWEKESRKKPQGNPLAISYGFDYNYLQCVQQLTREIGYNSGEKGQKTMFGYVRPFQSELLVKEYEQYKGIYCQLCRVLGKEYGLLARFSLSYDCTFYAMLALAVSGQPVCEVGGRCAANPLKKCRYLEANGEAYQKAAALSVLLTWHKLRDDREDEGFFKALGCRLLLPLVSRKAKKAAGRYPFLAELAQTAMTEQKAAEEKRAGPDECAEPTARLLQGLFGELAGEKKGQAAALEQFGYFLGRWVYLMDASDDLKEDAKEGKFNPFLLRLGFSEKRQLSEEEQKIAEKACNEALNATAAMLLPPLNLIDMEYFGPIVENVAQKGLPEIQREVLFLHVKEKRRKRVGAV